MMTYKGMWQKQSFFLECDKVKSKAKVGERCSEQFSKKKRGKNAMAILTSFYYSSIQLKYRREQFRIDV